MKFTHLMKLVMLLAALSLQVACLKTPNSNPEPSSLETARSGRFNVEPLINTGTPPPNYSTGAPGAAYSNGIAVTASDGRVLLVKPGTWEVISPAPLRDVVARMSNGQRVLIRPDGTWSYYGGGSGRGSGGPKVTKPPPPLEAPKPATVVFYQLGGDGGNGKATVFMDGRPVAALRSKRYFAIRVPSGEHIFTISKASQNPRVLTVTGGRTYYMRNKGGILNKEMLILDGVDEAEAAISKLKVINGVDVNRPEIMVEPRMSN